MQFLKGIEVKFNGKFVNSTFKKIIRFQSLQQLIINDSFLKLEGRFSNEKEKKNNKTYFVLASLYDDLMDDQIVSKEILNDMFLYPEKYKPSTFNEAVLMDAHLKLLNSVNDKSEYQNVLNQIQEAQIDSTLQVNEKIPQSTILSITKRKGGYSLLMCRHYLGTPSSDMIDQCWYHLGGLIQMTNDLYDIYKDTHEGIQTFANTQNTIIDIERMYNEQLKLFIKSIEMLPYAHLKITRLRIILSMIPAFGYLALENLRKLQGDNDHLLPFKDYERKDLIIDMEKFKNIIKLFKYSYQLGK
ncbi:MAG: hypothetical protein NTZ82_00460 [Bacteroidetes bacterium]|nr:hypothetical protein [Bacteroidota bacterium]